MLQWIKVTASSGDTIFIFVDHIRAIVETARGSTIITDQLDDGIPVLEYPEILLAQIAEIALERRASPNW